MAIEAGPGNASTPSRDRILDAAREVFAEDGLGAARVDEIARRAGCNKALIYYYFASKDELYDAVFAEEVERNMPIFEAVREATFHEWLEGLAEATTRHEDQPWIRLIAREGLEKPSTLTSQERRAQVWKDCIRMLKHAQAEGEVDPELDPEMVILMFLMSTLGSQTLSQFTELITGESPDTPAFTSRLRRFHLSIADQLRPRTDSTPSRPKPSDSSGRSDGLAG